MLLAFNVNTGDFYNKINIVCKKWLQLLKMSLYGSALIRKFTGGETLSKGHKCSDCQSSAELPVFPVAKRRV